MCVKDAFCLKKRPHTLGYDLEVSEWVYSANMVLSSLVLPCSKLVACLAVHSYNCSTCPTVCHA